MSTYLECGWHTPNLKILLNSHQIYKMFQILCWKILNSSAAWSFSSFTCIPCAKHMPGCAKHVFPALPSFKLNYMKTNAYAPFSQV